MITPILGSQWDPGNHLLNVPADASQPRPTRVWPSSQLCYWVEALWRSRARRLYGQWFACRLRSTWNAVAISEVEGWTILHVLQSEDRAPAFVCPWSRCTFDRQGRDSFHYPMRRLLWEWYGQFPACRRHTFADSGSTRNDAALAPARERL